MNDEMALKSNNKGIVVYGQILDNLRFADYIDLVAESPRQLRELTTG